MDVDEKQGARARWWAGGLIGLSLLGVVYQGWSETRAMRPVAPGHHAPGFRLRRFDGKGEVALADLTGHVVMLDFWATWCPPCVQELPVLGKLAQEYESRGLVFVAANRDDPETAQAAVERFVQRRGPELARYIAFAGDLTNDQYQVHVLPTLYFLGPDGAIVQSRLGLTSEAELRRLIESSLSGNGRAPLGQTAQNVDPAPH